jgi:hypothetical protein
MLLFASLAAALLAPSAALANDGNREGSPPSSEPFTVSFEVVSASAETRVAKVVLECAGGYSGKGVALKVGEGVEMSAFTVGAHLAGKVDRSTDPPTVVALLDSTCGDEPPKPQCPATVRNDGGEGCPKPEQPECPTPDPAPTSDDRVAAHYDRCGKPDDGKGDDRGEDRPREPKFRPSLLNRVWRFEGSADFFEDGVLGMTVETVKGLPKRLRDQDDELLDQDALVLVGSRTKVYGTDGKRTTADKLADADRVSVRGKLLPPAKWRDDEDGQATPTLRAKRVYVLS